MILIAALLLDAAFGEPRWLWDRMPHPAVLMGRLVGWCDVRFNRDGELKLKGTLVAAGLAPDRRGETFTLVELAALSRAVLGLRRD